MVLLPATVPGDEPCANTRDAEETLAILRHQPAADWVVVDHYALDRVWEQAMRRASTRVLAIGGVPNRSHDCEILHDQNVLRDAEETWRRLCTPDTTLLLGPEFALLRGEFRKARADRERRTSFPVDLVVAFGASDPTQATDRVLDALSDPLLGDLRATVVVGSANPRAAALRDRAAVLPGTTVVVDTPAMGDLFARARWALLAGGVQVLEAMCTGVPVAVWPQVDNQRHATAELLRRGACVALDAGDGSPQAIVAALRSRLDDPRVACKVGETGRALVDGLGATRVAQAMLSRHP